MNDLPITGILFLIGFGFFCVLFRTQIAGWIQRTPGGAKLPLGFAIGQQAGAMAAEAQKTAEKPQEHIETSKLNPAFGPPPDTLLQPIEDQAINSVRSVYPNDADLQVRWLARYYAMVWIDKTHEQVYRMILGSQISLLRALAQSPWLPIQRARQTLEVAKVTQTWLKDMSFDQWFGFLSTRNLVFYNGNADQIVISDAGRRFLVYMTTNGLPDKF